MRGKKTKKQNERKYSEKEVTEMIQEIAEVVSSSYDIVNGMIISNQLVSRSSYQNYKISRGALNKLRKVQKKIPKDITSKLKIDGESWNELISKIKEYTAYAKEDYETYRDKN